MIVTPVCRQFQNRAGLDVNIIWCKRYDTIRASKYGLSVYAECSELGFEWFVSRWIWFEWFGRIIRIQQVQSTPRRQTDVYTLKAFSKALWHILWRHDPGIVINRRPKSLLQIMLQRMHASMNNLIMSSIVSASSIIIVSTSDSSDLMDQQATVLYDWWTPLLSWIWIPTVDILEGRHPVWRID